MTLPGTNAMAVNPAAWAEANQRYLAAALDVIRIPLEDHATVPAERRRAPEVRFESLASAEKNLPAPSALHRLCEKFKLSPFERDLLLLCAGCELESAVIKLCAAAQRDERRTLPTFSLALAVLPEPHWSALSPSAPLRHWHLLEVGPGEHLTTSPLRIDERILHFLTGVDAPDVRLCGSLEAVPSIDPLSPSQVKTAGELAAVWRRVQEADTDGPVPAVQLTGSDSFSLAAITALAATTGRMELKMLRATRLPQPAAELDTFARLLEREAMLGNFAIALELEVAASPGIVGATAALLERTRHPVVVCGGETVHLRSRPLLRIEVTRTTSAEQRQLWQDALGQSATAHLNGDVDRVLAQFQLNPDAIRTVGHAIARHHAADRASPLGPLLWTTCRAQCRPALNGLAVRIEALATWQDLVLPIGPRQTLRTLAAHVRQRTRVYQEWGFAARSDRGLGIVALFVGASGTGKTMAAEVLANELGLDLYRIDLSSLISKYIGETEKNLRQVFDAAESGGAILLFDEADAVFGRRSEVRDSHDRYANIEVSYLLQRLESYRGLVILTSNQPQSLDAAFSRRIRFVVTFPFPDATQRAEIWRRAFPTDTPTENLQIDKLARLTLAGGHIRNLALNAAFLAADDNEPVRMKHLLAAAQSEYAKLEKSLSTSETAGWV